MNDTTVTESANRALKTAEKRIITVSFETSADAITEYYRDRRGGDKALGSFYNKTAKEYAYFTDDPLVDVGDLVIVATPHGSGPSLRLPGDAEDRKLTFARVTSVKPTVSAGAKASQWIVGRVDAAGWLARVEEARKREHLEKRIDKVATEMRKRMDLDILAAKNPELAEMIAELDRMNGKTIDGTATAIEGPKA